MTTIADPSLQAFQDADPTVLRPSLERTVDVSVPRWYDNTVIELAGAILAIRALVAVTAARQSPPPVADAEAVAGQAWRHHAPTWLQFAVPAVKQAYAAGRIDGLTDAELTVMATDYVEGLGEYLSETNAQAVAEGFEAQLNRGWSAELAWHRVNAGYGLDRPDMRAYLRAITAAPKGVGSPVATGAQILVDRLLIERADRVASTEMWMASESGLAMSWLVRQRRGEIPADAMREWRTRRGETPCAICGPMNGVRVGLEDSFMLGDGTQIWSPGAHPGCRCSQRLVEPISKLAKTTIAAGVLLVAADTGRWLMIQRANDPKDPAAGVWELPGGHIDPGETPLQTARREFSEEVHRHLPSDARYTSSWKRGAYEGFVHITSREANVEPHVRGRIANPDDPDGDQIEAIAWWDPGHLSRNPAVRPELRRGLPAVREAVRNSRIAKAKRLDNGRQDPYNRTKAGRFAQQEYRTRDVTHLVELSPEAQAIVDQATREVANPFAAPSKPVTANPFALPLTANPFAATENPFAAPKVNPFLGASAGPNPFDQTKKPTDRSGNAKRVIHHILLPKKRASDRGGKRAPGGFYMPYTEFIESFDEDPGNQVLIEPGDRYDFDEAGESTLVTGFMEGRWHTDLMDKARPYIRDGQYGIPEVIDKLPPEVRQVVAPVAIMTADPWSDIVPEHDANAADERTSTSLWNQIKPVAKGIFDYAIENPRGYVDQLSRRDLDRIYDVAGYERNETDPVARERIIDHCQAYGVGDDSLAEAFADHVVWTRMDKTSEGEHLNYLLQQGEENDNPSMDYSYGIENIDQAFVWERGFHPETNVRNDVHADVEGKYVVGHIIYRSNLGENGGDAMPWTVGLREASLWPADASGHPLHGGPYPM